MPPSTACSNDSEQHCRPQLCRTSTGTSVAVKMAAATKLVVKLVKGDSGGHMQTLYNGFTSNPENGMTSYEYATLINQLAAASETQVPDTTALFEVSEVHEPPTRTALATVTSCFHCCSV